MIVLFCGSCNFWKHPLTRSMNIFFCHCVFDYTTLPPPHRPFPYRFSPPTRVMRTFTKKVNLFSSAFKKEAIRSTATLGKLARIESLGSHRKDNIRFCGWEYRLRFLGRMTSNVFDGLNNCECCCSPEQQRPDKECVWLTAVILVGVNRQKPRGGYKCFEPNTWWRFRNENVKGNR